MEGIGIIILILGVLAGIFYFSMVILAYLIYAYGWLYYGFRKLLERSKKN